MGTSFVEFRRFGFWSRDGVLEDWLSSLVATMDSMRLADSWQNEMRNAWAFEASVGKIGWITPDLDKFLSSDERVQFTLELSRHALKSVDSPQLRRMGELFTGLLEGKLKTTVESPIDYWDGT